MKLSFTFAINFTRDNNASSEVVDDIPVILEGNHAQVERGPENYPLGFVPSELDTPVI